MEKTTEAISLTINSSEKPETICIFGTGDFGRSLGLKMLQCGYSIIFGSRNSQNCNLLPSGTEILNYYEAAQKSDIIVIAVHREHYDFLTELTEVLNGKILVDVSNNVKSNQYAESNAEYLARLVPGAHVVKAFNTISAWALQTGALDASRQVFVCGNDSKAKQRVMAIVPTLGLSPLDQGSLKAAKEIEDYPLRLFPMWKFPFYLSAALFIFLFFYGVIRDVIYFYVYKEKDCTVSLVYSIPSHICPEIALILLGLVYLPGIIAAILQLYRGTKYHRFPNWLDHWILCRKQLGLVSLGFSSLHVLFIFSTPLRYISLWHFKNITITQVTLQKENVFSTHRAWFSDSCLTLGMLGFALFVLLGITSLPSVSNLVNWREFRFIQSKLGYLTLILCTAHTTGYGWREFVSSKFLRWYLPSSFLLTLIIPCTVIVIKCILILPCIDRTLIRIRQGWERNSKSSESSLNRKTKF